MLAELLDDVLVDLLGHAEYLKALGAHQLRLRQAQYLVHVLAHGVVYELLLGRHAVRVLLERRGLVLGDVVDEQVAQGLYVLAVIGHGAVAELAAVVLVELLVLRPVVSSILSSSFLIRLLKTAI